jgi:hypothetical protein
MARPAPLPPDAWVLEMRAKLERLAASPPVQDPASGVQQLAQILLDVMARAEAENQE